MILLRHSPSYLIRVVQTMEPGTIVRPHFALANDHLRLHLGIDIPEPDMVDLVVGGERHGWEQGRVIAFDDSIVHSVRHRGQLNRTVLIVDILHPAHPEPSEVLHDTTSEEEFEAIRRRQKAWTSFF